MLHPTPRTPLSNHFPLVGSNDRLGERVVVGVAYASYRRLDPPLPQALGVAGREVLRTPVAVVHKLTCVSG